MQPRSSQFVVLLVGLAGLSGLAGCSTGAGAVPFAAAPSTTTVVTTTTAPTTTASATTGTPAPEATVIRWVDGDTLEVQLGPGEPTTVRLLDVDTPEFRSYGGRNECVDPDLAARAAARAEAIAPQGSTVALAADGTDRYGRTLARVATPAGDVGERLVEDGLARRWPDGACPS